MRLDQAINRPNVAGASQTYAGGRAQTDRSPARRRHLLNHQTRDSAYRSFRLDAGTSAIRSRGGTGRTNHCRAAILASERDTPAPPATSIVRAPRLVFHQAGSAFMA